ncbi:MAG TPA: DUF1499 domain-containing protein [Paracoccaceae bacterium]|nr:DUF1499 domain-containing protein [Paracoccaceae bacterium]
MVWTLGLLAALLAGVMVWVRAAPSDPARWHGDPVTAAPADCAVRAGAGDARAACLLAGTPAEVLARLDAVALASPRTQRLAGSPEEGRITWVTRSALWGFPDYTTAAARAEGDGARLDLYARLRFGQSDLGVNAARLGDWLTRLGSGQ